MMKPDKRAMARLLQPLEIPSREWVHVTTDLITDLPASNRFTAIVVFVDKLTKMVHLAGWKKEVATMEYAQIVVGNIFWLQGPPEITISDRDPHLPASFDVQCLTCSV